MAKHSMRGYYAIGALVLCIILLYVIVRNVEPFESQEEVHVYFTSGAGNSITNIKSSNPSIVVVPTTTNAGTLTLTIGTLYKLNSINDVKISSINNTTSTNCTTRISNTAYCWANVNNDRTAVSLNGAQLYSFKKQGTAQNIINKLNSPLNLTSLANNELINPAKVPPTLVVDPTSKGMPPGANVRITLILTKK